MRHILSIAIILCLLILVAVFSCLIPTPKSPNPASTWHLKSNQ